MTLIDRGANVSLANVGASGPFVVLGTVDGAPRVDVSGIGDSNHCHVFFVREQLFFTSFFLSLSCPFDSFNC